MLTPDFKLSQTQKQVIVVLRLPYVKVNACEFYIEQLGFKFYLKPYLLSLSFQQKLEEAEEPAKATYYHDKHLLEVHLKKKIEGQFFENLHLLSSLINAKKPKSHKPKSNLIEVVGDQTQIKVDNNSNGKKNNYSYGFCHNYQQVFKNLEEECYQIFSFNPQEVAIIDRPQLAFSILESCKDQEGYLFDKYENQQIQRIVGSEQLQKCMRQDIKKFTSWQPSNYQQFKLQLKLPNKQLMIDSSEENNILKQLISIAFCYLYELVCMEGQLSVQSAKTINSTSAVLNCCLSYEGQQIEDVIKDSSKRCLVYSLYKHVDICNKVIAYLSKNLNENLICCILSNLRVLFNKSEPRYLLNTIFIDDYLIYCLKKNKFEELSKIKNILSAISINEKQIGFEFDQLDEEGEEVQQKEQLVEITPQPKIVELQFSQN